jgi:hypothetical protein
MRTILAAALALIAGTMSVSAQAADPYRWCALYFGDGLGGTTKREGGWSPPKVSVT